MKKTLILAGAALLALVACNKSETVVKEANPGEISFKAVTSAQTKGAELTGTVMPKTYGIYAAATQKNASGIMENPKFFSGTEQLFGTTEATPSSSTIWHAGTVSGDPAVYTTPTPIYWPIGNVKMDFLAYAMPTADHNAIAVSDAAAADWTAFWNNYLTDSASKLSFNGVNTYVNQVDVLYSVKNDRTSANSGASLYVPMTFNHAQALLIFNVQANVASKIQINEIAFYTDTRVTAMRTDQVAVAGGAASSLAALADADVTLKTVGTFTVDNTRNTLSANWTFGNDACKAANYKIKSGVTSKSASNAKPAVAGDVNDFVLIDTADKWFQLGETLLIPEQEKVNFTIKYTVGGNTYFYTYNDLRGVWEKGKVYIYNLDLTLTEIAITENVVDFVDALTHPGDGTGTGEVPLS